MNKCRYTINGDKVFYGVVRDQSISYDVDCDTYYGWVILEDIVTLACLAKKINMQRTSIYRYHQASRVFIMQNRVCRITKLEDVDMGSIKVYFETVS